MDNYLKYLYGNNEFKAAFRYILENNKANKNTYHNNHHLLGVFNYTMKMAYYYNFSKEDRIILGLAALFHDFNHSGGKLKDDENIEISIKGLTDFINNTDELDYLREDGIEEISDLIKVTEYPHKGEPSTLASQILVDADLLSVFQDPNWFNDVVVALSHEYGNDISTQVDMQIDFVTNIKLYTEYAKKIEAENKERILSELKFLKIIFK